MDSSSGECAVVPTVLAPDLPHAGCGNNLGASECAGMAGATSPTFCRNVVDLNGNAYRVGVFCRSPCITARHDAHLCLFEILREKAAMQHIRFGLGFLLVTVIGWTMYVALFVLQLGARTGAEYWMYDAEIVKHHLANAQAKKNKVLFLGGSSVWFGIDTGLVQETLGIETINLGLHAMRPLDRILNEVRPVLRPGDTIIMPLEFEFYMIDTPYNEWYVNEIMAGEPELFWTWNWPEKISFFFSVPPMRVFEGVTTRLFANRVANINQRIPGHPPEQVIASIQETWAKGALPEENYTFRNINHHGDAIVTRGSFSSYVYPISGEEVARDYHEDARLIRTVLHSPIHPHLGQLAAGGER